MLAPHHSHALRQDDPRIPVLHDMLVTLEADLAVLHGMRHARGGGPGFFADVALVGLPPLVQDMKALEGFAISDLESDLGRSFPTNTFGFIRIASLAPTIADGMWRRLGLGDGMGAMITHQDTILAAVSVMRSDQRPRFDRDDLRQARPAIKVLRRATLTQQAHDAHLEPVDGTVLFHTDGRLAFVTPPFDTSSDLVVEMGALAQRFARGDTGPRAMLGSLRVHMSRLMGDDGDLVSVTTQDTVPLALSPVMTFTPIKRRIVAMAIQGASVPEMAERMSRSPETIRAHLKQIYETMGVSSRVDLAEACRNVYG